MPRLFVAVDLPPTIQNTLAELSTGVEGAKWVPYEQIHLTLRFIGDVSDQVFADLKETLAQIRTEPFDLKIDGTGSFGRPARVLWVGVEPKEPVISLNAKVEEAVTAAGLPEESRPFSPHITLARLKKRVSPAHVRRYLETHKDLVTDPFQVKELKLYSSVLSNKGAKHTVEAITHFGSGL